MNHPRGDSCSSSRGVELGLPPPNVARGQSKRSGFGPMRRGLTPTKMSRPCAAGPTPPFPPSREIHDDRTPTSICISRSISRRRAARMRLRFASWPEPRYSFRRLRCLTGHDKYRPATIILGYEVSRCPLCGHTKSDLPSTHSIGEPAPLPGARDNLVRRGKII